MSKDNNIIHIAIVGKPNVGKSTLFNRLVGMRKSITDSRGGTTRDRLYERANIREKEIYLIDTGGIQFARDGNIDFLVDREVNKALIEADLIIFVCEKVGLSNFDYQLVDNIRRRNKKVVLVVNKVDSGEGDLRDFYSLKIGEPLPISALHNVNIDKLISTIYDILPSPCIIPKVRYEFKLSIIGEPNSGKSTLLNSLLRNERVVVSEVPGTTRDIVEENYECDGRIIRLVDTAGIKKKKKLKSTAAVFSLFRTKKSIQRTDLCFLLIDALRGPQKDTRAIYKIIRENNKACIILVNKWDKVSGLPMESYKKRLIKEYGFFQNTPILFISALTKRNLDNAMREVFRIWENYTVSIATKELNLFLRDIRRQNPPPPLVKFKYIVQADIKPPTFVLFVKNKKNIKEEYIRYIINGLIGGFSLDGVVPKLILKEEEKKV